jgi:hypothetical protein
MQELHKKRFTTPLDSTSSRCHLSLQGVQLTLPSNFLRSGFIRTKIGTVEQNPGRSTGGASSGESFPPLRAEANDTWGTSDLLLNKVGRSHPRGSTKKQLSQDPTSLYRNRSEDSFHYVREDLIRASIAIA